MPRSNASQDQVVEFPLFRGRAGYFGKLDGFVMDELTPVIGFERGAYALYKAGYRFIGDLIAATPEAIGQVPGIGPRKLEQILAHVALLNLSWGEDTADWREYRRRFAAVRSCGSIEAGPEPQGRRKHLRVVSL